jgi:ATP-dependent Lon protease
MDEIQFEDEALKEVIKYSNEMGVRELERKIAKICRKVARKNKSGNKEVINLEKVEEFLGKRYKRERWNGIGVVNGMAWTAMGGKLLMVESISYPNSKGKI